MSNIYESSAFIYPQRADAVITTSTSTLRNNVKNVYRPFKISKGINTEILFYVRDTAGKPLRVADKSFFAKILKPNSNTVVLTKELYKKSDMTGVISLRIYAQDSFGLATGIHNIVLEMKDSRGITTQIYVDESYRTNYVLEVNDNKVSNPANVTQVKEYYQFDNDYFISNQMPGSSQSPGSLGISTLALYLENFSGEILLEASLESTPKNRDWFAIKLSRFNETTYENYTGIDAFAIEGKYFWFRIKYKSNSGNIQQVLISL